MSAPKITGQIIGAISVLRAQHRATLAHLDDLKSCIITADKQAEDLQRQMVEHMMETGDLTNGRSTERVGHQEPGDHDNNHSR